MTHPRPLSDAEMMEAAKNLDDEVAYFGDSQAYYKLYNTSQCAVFYFYNGERSKTLSALFDMTIQNLQIQGEEPGCSQFNVEIGPGKSCYKILKPIVEGEATEIQMRFEFNLN